MNFLEGPISIRDLGRSSAFDGNSTVGFHNGVKLQNVDNLFYPNQVWSPEGKAFSCVKRDALHHGCFHKHLPDV